jgi:hypothetical protein
MTKMSNNNNLKTANDLLSIPSQRRPSQETRQALPQLKGHNYQPLSSVKTIKKLYTLELQQLKPVPQIQTGLSSTPLSPAAKKKKLT